MVCPSKRDKYAAWSEQNRVFTIPSKIEGDKMTDNKGVGPISSFEYLEKLISFKAFLKKGKEFAPEDWLSSMGYEFVEPNRFTKGHRIAYKIIDEFPDQRFNSNYSLVKGEREILLYLKTEMPKNEQSSAQSAI